MPIYKIVPDALWRDAEEAGTFVGAPVDLQDGFIHFSTADQVGETAARHFTGQADLLLVEVDDGVLGEVLRFEPSRGGDLFPHLYGPLPVSAARAARPMRLGREGQHVLPGLPMRHDPASVGWTSAGGRAFVALIGPLWRRGEGEARQFGFLAEERHLNAMRVVHGGMMMSFADEAMGRTAYLATGGRRQVTIQLDTHFIGPTFSGEFVTAECRVARQTGSLTFMDGRFTAGDRLVGSATGIWKRVGG